MIDLFIYLDGLYLYMLQSQVKELPLDDHRKLVIKDGSHYTGMDVIDSTTPERRVICFIPALANHLQSGDSDYPSFVDTLGWDECLKELIRVVGVLKAPLHLPADWVGLFGMIEKFQSDIFDMEFNGVGEIRVKVDKALSSVDVYPSNSRFSPPYPVPFFKTHCYLQHLILDRLKSEVNK